MNIARNRTSVFAESSRDPQWPESAVQVVSFVALFYVVSFYITIFRNLTPTLNKDILHSDTSVSATTINLMGFSGIIIVPTRTIEVINYYV